MKQIFYAIAKDFILGWVVLWCDFFTWRPDAFQVTGRARYEPVACYA